jgi:hypothetical protein
LRLDGSTKRVVRRIITAKSRVFLVEIVVGVTVISDDPLRSRDESFGIHGLEGTFQINVVSHAFISH